MVNVMDFTRSYFAADRYSAKKMAKPVNFVCIAPEAKHVHLMGDFNSWDGRFHQMRSLGPSGVWEIFIPGVGEGTHYKYEVRDLHGRSYRVGERPQDIMGRSRAWMLWLPAAAMAAISVLQYGYSVAATALQPTGAAAFWVLALWVMCQAGAAALTAALRHHSAVAPSRAMLAGALLCATGPLTLAYTDSFALAVLGYSVLCGSGAGIVYATCSSTVAKWYPEARGLRIGFVTGAFGYGAVPFISLFAVGLSPANHAAMFTVVGVAVLAVAVGLPFFVVSATSPLLQRWFSAGEHRHAADPYFLYAASNCGSSTC